MIICPRLHTKAQDYVKVIKQDGHLPGSMAVVLCDVGFVFPDGSTLRSLVCTEAGKWSSGIPSCQGKLKPVAHVATFLRDLENVLDFSG